VLRSAMAALGSWPARRWGAALAGSIVAGLLIGIPTRIVPTPLFTRMTPVTWWDYPVWAVSALLAGLLAATYVRSATPPPPAPDTARALAPEKSKRTLGAVLLTGFAVGCPICNKLVVALIGVSGALNYWAPLQPVLGVLSVALLAVGLAVRLRGELACPVTLGP